MASIVEVLSQDFELPDNLIEETLTCLPAEYIWKLGTSGDEQLDKSPWLIAGGVDNNRDCWAYSTHIRGKWQTASLSLPFMNLYQEEDAKQILAPFSYLASTASLFLFQRNVNLSIYVCNPVTGKFFILPPMTSQEEYIIGEIGIVQEGDGYKVVALHYSNTQNEHCIVGVYHSSDKQWRMAGRVPESVLEWTDDRMIFSGDYFYCLMRLYDRNDEVHGILRFNLREGPLLFKELPAIINEIIIGHREMRCFLLNCGSRILLVAIVKLETSDKVVTSVWELNGFTDWKEISRMPDSILNCTNLDEFDCAAGTEDCIYFQNHREFAMYSLSKNSWTSLPSCPFAGVSEISRLILFEPRPDIKVE